MSSLNIETVDFYSIFGVLENMILQNCIDRGGEMKTPLEESQSALKTGPTFLGGLERNMGFTFITFSWHQSPRPPSVVKTLLIKTGAHKAKS